MRCSVAALLAVGLLAAPHPTAAQSCVGDCNGNRAVTIEELIRGVNIALGNTALSQCTALDRNANGQVTIDELIAAVSAALNGCPPASLSVRITSPSSFALFNHSPISVSGEVTGSGVAVVVGGVQATVTGSTFTAAGVALVEGQNTITAVATDAGAQTATDSITVTLDTQAPRVVIEAPAPGTRTAEVSLPVAGMVNDIVSGVVNGDDVSVTVNGVAATVAAGAFVASDVPLALGANTVTARATDAAGNAGTAVVTITRIAQGAAANLVYLSGNEQQGLPGAPLAPLAVRVRDVLGNAIAGRAVRFRVTRGDGTFADGTRETTVFTSAAGEAAVAYALGTRAGVGLHRVSADAEEAIGQVDFCETAVGGAPAQVHIQSGDLQRVPAGDRVPEPFVVIVRDAAGNPVSGALVAFTRLRGSGSFDGAPAFNTTSDANGRAAASYTAGAVAVDTVEQISARLPAAGDPAIFTITALTPGDPAATTFTGVVVDNSNRPLPGTRVSVSGATPPIEALTDVNGRFTLAGVPSGPFDLEVIGPRSFQSSGGDFPPLRFNAFAVAGRENSLAEPIYLPAIDRDNEQLAGGAQDVDVPIEGIEGARLRVFANSLALSDGNRTAYVSATQVNQDKVPMPFPGGVAPALVLTIQPPNARFDPPAQLVLPNLDGKPPGYIQNLLSFDHDREEYVVVGTATVSEDGSEVVTDRGFGVIKGGWHGSPTDPNPPGNVTGNVNDPNNPPPSPTSGPSAAPTRQPTQRPTATPSGQSTRPPTATATGPTRTATRTRPPTRTPRTPTTTPTRQPTTPGSPTATPTDMGPRPIPPTPNNGRPGPPNEGGTTDPAAGGGGPTEDPTRPTTQTGGDAIIFGTGELVIEATDLTIPGRGFDFTMKRVYRSQFNYNGVLGHNWDFSYNERLTVPAPGAADQDVLRCNGASRVDRFDRSPDGAFASPPGSYTGLRRNPDGTYVLRARDGFRRYYAADGRLSSLADRHGNTMTFTYDAQGRLTVVTDTLGRPVRFAYNAVGRLAAVTDFIGRELRYYYDGHGDLVAVRSPVVVGTSTGNDFPDGKVTRYEYASGFDETADPRNAFLNHNLLAITDPLNQRYLVNTYGTQLGTYGFDRVVAQQWGRPDQVSTYTYTELNPGQGNTDPALARNRTTEIDRNGDRRVYLHNAVGNLLEAHVETNRNVNPDDPAEFVTRSTYNADGELVATVFPEGNRVEYGYDTASVERAGRGNVTAETRLPGPRGGTQTQIRRTFEYEPIYNQRRAATDPRGTDAGFTPPNGGATSAARYTTTSTFDYQEGNDLAALAAELGRTPAEVTALLAAAGVPLGIGDLNGDGVTDQIRGDVVRREQPTVRLLPGSQQAQVEGDETQEIVRTYTYNRFGQLIAETDPEGNVDEYEYHPENDPDGDGIVSSASPALAADTGGYLAATITDGRTSPLRRDSTEPRRIRRERSYDEVGNVIRLTDGRGNTTSTEHNALNQVVRQTLPAPFNYEVRFLYDANGNVVARGVQNVETNGPGLGDFVFTRYEYDTLDFPTRMFEEVSVESDLVTDYEYDANQNLIRTTLPEGNRVEQVFDERNLVYRRTRGAGTAEASTVTHTYDGNGILARVVDAQDTDGDGSAEQTRLVCDGYDRVVERIDGTGNRVANTYDPAGNLVRRQTRGPNGGPSPLGTAGTGNVLLADVASSFDELDRLYQSDARLFANTTTAGSDGPLTPGDGKVTTRVEFDRLGRRTRVLDDNAHQTTMEYDGADRLVRRTDQLGNEQRFEHDANDNVVTASATERSPEASVPAETFTTRTTFDALDRASSVTDNLGNVTVFAYDSRGNRVRVQDPLGNRTLRVYDGRNRLLEEHRELRASGTGSGAFDVANPANPDGLITRQLEWDGNSRLLAVTDDRGNRTGYEYDALDRRTVTTFADGTTARSEYDRDDNLVRTTDQNGTVVARRYDGINRLTAEDVTRAAGVAGSTQRRYEYDGLSRLTRATDNNDPSDAADDGTVERDYDSLGRLLRERQNGTAVATRVDGVGNAIALTYPSGRVVEMTPDALDRLDVIRDQGSPGVIADYDYLGPGRTLERRFGNGTRLSYRDSAQDVGYDGIRRVVRHRHETTAGGDLVASFQYAYDRAGNRRYEISALDDRAQIYEYDSTYRLTRSAKQVAAASVAAIANNESTNADVQTLAGANEDVFVLDGVGNWATRTTDGQPVTFARNEMNEYTSVGGAPQTHDATGNRLTDAAGRYAYDFANRLVRVETPAGAERARYAYDALGRRIGTRRGAETTRAYYAGERLIEERDGAGALLRQYVFGRGLDELLEIATPDARFFAHDDSLGSIVALTDASGAVIERYAYDVYGVPAILEPDGVTPRAASAVGHPFRFTGQRYDAESGLYFYRARSYDPRTGRFLQRDPKGYGDGLGLYVYVNDNPVNFTDPMGTERSGDDPCRGRGGLGGVLGSITSTLGGLAPGGVVPPGLESALSSVTGSLNQLGQLTESLGPLLQNLGNQLQEGAPAAPAGGTGGRGGLGGVLSNITTTLSGLAPGGVAPPGLESALSGVNESLSQLGQLTESLGPLLQDLGNQLQTAAPAGGTGGRGGLGGVLGNVASALNGLAPGGVMPPGLQTALSGVNESLSQLGQLNQSLGPLLENIGNQLQNAAPGAPAGGTSGRGGLGGVLSSITSTLGNLQSGAGLSSVLGGLNGPLSQLGSNLEALNGLQALLEANGEAAGGLQDLLQQMDGAQCPIGSGP